MVRQCHYAERVTPQDRHVQLSKFLSYALRHAAADVRLRIDRHGWARMSDLVLACNDAGLQTDAAELLRVMAQGEKQRFELDARSGRARSTHGHSMDIDLGLAPEVPPSVLFHGTSARAVERVLAEGIHRARRQFVHLTADPESAAIVAGRRGRAVVLNVDAARLHADGGAFFRSAGGVWLTREVPPAYVTVA